MITRKDFLRKVAIGFVGIVLSEKLKIVESLVNVPDTALVEVPNSTIPHLFQTNVPKGYFSNGDIMISQANQLTYYISKGNGKMMATCIDVPDLFIELNEVEGILEPHERPHYLRICNAFQEKSNQNE